MLSLAKLLEEKKTARITVLLQPSLQREMREFTLSGINWSAVARQAFVKKIKELRKAVGK